MSWDSKASRMAWTGSTGVIGFSAGAGLWAAYGSMQGTLDYAYTDGGALGAVNRLSLGVRF